jgi:hypothetical protein
MRAAAAIALVLLAHASAWRAPSRSPTRWAVSAAATRPLVARARASPVALVQRASRGGGGGIGRLPPLGEPVARRSNREALIAKGLAGAVLLRVAAASAGWALVAAVLMAVTVVAPVIAVEAVLLALAFVATGLANYWPINLVVFAFGSAGLAGCLQGVLVWWEARRAAAARRRGEKAPRRNRREEEAARPSRSTPEDGSAGLVALLIGTLTASIVGALP